MEVVRLSANDYDEWQWVLNTVFGRKNKRPMDFEQELPKMCVRDDRHMAKHIAVKEKGKICSVLGVYPFPVSIAGKELLFSTVGNVATLPEHEGKGYMQLLLTEAMEELQRIGAGASRLGGARQRYNRFGYEACGTQYTFEINEHCRVHCMVPQTPRIEFRKVEADSVRLLTAVERIHAGQAIRVLRSREDGLRGVYATLTAWKNVPYLAFGPDGTPAGYLSVSADGRNIAEACAENPELLKAILFRWQEKIGEPVSFTLAPFETEAVRYFSAAAASMFVSAPCHFKFLHYDRVADALMKLKRDMTPGLPDGERIVGIEGYGNLRLYADGNCAGCERTKQPARLVLDRLQANRLLFGPLPFAVQTEFDPFLSAWLPLPLSWNTLDRT